MQKDKIEDKIKKQLFSGQLAYKSDKAGVGASIKFETNNQSYPPGITSLKFLHGPEKFSYNHTIQDFIENLGTYFECTKPDIYKHFDSLYTNKVDFEMELQSNLSGKPLDMSLKEYLEITPTPIQTYNFAVIFDVTRQNFDQKYLELFLECQIALKIFDKNWPDEKVHLSICVTKPLRK